VRSSNLVRWGGIAAVVAGLIFIVLLVLTNPQQGLAPDPVFSGLPSTVLFIGALLGQMAGVAGLHALQRGQFQSMLEAVWSTRVWREGTIHSITRSLMMASGG
jgi:hypothetical protein